jgi:hypothetical protein
MQMQKIETSRQINILYGQEIDFLLSTNFKLLRQIKGNLKNNFVLNVVISARGRHCDWSPRASKNLAASLKITDCRAKIVCIFRLMAVTDNPLETGM